MRPFRLLNRWVERDTVHRLPQNGIDPVVSEIIAKTNGNAYRHLVGKQFPYPIPDIPLSNGNGSTLLDIGCGWGRWSIAANQKRYRVTGITLHTSVIAAARRVADGFGADATFLTGDAKRLPFSDCAFDVVFSFGVLQHFSPDNAKRAIAEIGRVLKRGGFAKVQMAQRFGARNLYVQAKRGFREARASEVRYWRLAALRNAFEEAIGPTSIAPHCFFGLGLERSDIALLRTHGAMLVRASDAFVRASRVMPSLVDIADSVYVTAIKP